MSLNDLKNIGGLTLVMFKFESNEYIDEEKDKNLFIPDGVNIAYVISNFCNLYHEDYINLSKEYIKNSKEIYKKYNLNRGRKEKEKIKKNIKKNNGSNKEFSSCITFGVIYNNKVYGVKIFHMNSGNISKLTYEEIYTPNYIKNLLNILFSYISLYKNITLKYISHELQLANTASVYPLEKNKIINLYKLRKILYLSSYSPEYWDCDNCEYNFNGHVTNFKINLYMKTENEKKGKEKIINIKLLPEGKIYAYGGFSLEQNLDKINRLHKILDMHANKIIITGYRSSKIPKKRPDYSDVNKINELKNLKNLR